MKKRPFPWLKANGGQFDFVSRSGTPMGRVHRTFMVNPTLPRKLPRSVQIGLYNDYRSL